MLSFIQYLTEVHTNQTFGDDTKTYDVDKIIRLSQIKRANTRQVSDLISLNGELTNAEGNFHELLRNPTPEFMARVKQADTRFPIHVDTDGNVIDGSHRLAALHFAGERYAKVHVVGSNVLAKTRLTEAKSRYPDVPFLNAGRLPDDHPLSNYAEENHFRWVTPDGYGVESVTGGGRGVYGPGHTGQYTDGDTYITDAESDAHARAIIRQHRTLSNPLLGYPNHKGHRAAVEAEAVKTK